MAYCAMRQPAVLGLGRLGPAGGWWLLAGRWLLLLLLLLLLLATGEGEVRGARCRVLPMAGVACCWLALGTGTGYTYT
jgi:hypothetical protein